MFGAILLLNLSFFQRFSPMQGSWQIPKNAGFVGNWWYQRKATAPSSCLTLAGLAERLLGWLPNRIVYIHFSHCIPLVFMDLTYSQATTHPSDPKKHKSCDLLGSDTEALVTDKMGQTMFRSTVATWMS